MIRQVLKKDWTLLWPMAVLVTAIQAALEYVVFSADLIDASPVAGELIRPLTLAWFLALTVMTVAVVQQDPIPGVDQDWLIRPLRRRDLLAAKMVFVMATVSLPMFVLDVTHALRAGFLPWAALTELSYKEAYVFAFLLVPVLALAATTRNLVELVLLGAALMVVYTVSSGLSTLLLGAARCATCGSGLVWLEHLLQHGAALAGAVVVLAWQYARRRTNLSRTLLVSGAAILVFLQLPWDTAFAIQQRLSGTPGLGAGIAVQIGTITRAQGGAADSPVPIAGRQATRALLRGDVDAAMNTFHSLGHRNVGVLTVPLRVIGVAADELLLVDRVAVQLVTAAGGSAYVGTLDDQTADSLTTAANDVGDATPALVRVPEAALQRAHSLRLEYSLTLVKVSARYRLPALDGEFRSADLGICRTQRDQNNIALRCRQLGQGPFCYGATVVGPDGNHNPEIVKCQPDYRPYIPAFTSVFSYSGLDLPVRDRYGLAHYPVDASQLDRSSVVIRVYAVRDHFKRAAAAVL